MIGGPTFDARDVVEMRRLARALDMTVGRHPRPLEELEAIGNRSKR